MNTLSDARLRQRKFFLVLPLLVLPFPALAFWALGGGQVLLFRLPDATGIGGLSLSLPDPQLKAGERAGQAQPLRAVPAHLLQTNG